MSLIFDTVEGPYLATEITDCLVEGKKYYKEEIPPYIEWKGEEIVKINIFAPMGYDFLNWKKIFQRELCHVLQFAMMLWQREYLNKQAFVN